MTSPTPDLGRFGIDIDVKSSKIAKGAAARSWAPVLVVTAVEAERQALRSTLAAVESTVDVVVVGVGPAAAGAGTAWRLAAAATAGRPYATVVSAGVGGGFVGRTTIGGLVVGTRSVAADLGAGSSAGFIPLDELGFGPTSVPADPALVGALAGALPDAVTGAVVTVSTVTGTAARARDLLDRYPDAAAEAMEGFGVACAARLAGVAYGEVRAISNPVGPRERGQWRLAAALDALAGAGAALATLVS
jgi:futalosine hydrolase